MLTLLLASLTVAAPPAAPRAGHYYRAPFVESVAAGTFDPERYVTHREPNLRWTPPRLSVDHGQEVTNLQVRSVRTGTTTRWESKGSEGGWTSITVRVLGPDRFETDVAGTLETWVRLPTAFDELARKTQEARTAEQRRALVGRYTDAAGAALVLGPKTGFRLSRCLESCRSNSRAWCVVHKRVTYRLDGEALVEVAPPEGLCPDGLAFEPKADGRRFQRVAK